MLLLFTISCLAPLATGNTCRVSADPHRCPVAALPRDSGHGPLAFGMRCCIPAGGKKISLPVPQPPVHGILQAGQWRGSHFLLQGIFLTLVGYSPWSYRESDTIKGLTLSLYFFTFPQPTTPPQSRTTPSLVPGFGWARDSSTQWPHQSREEVCFHTLLEDDTGQCSPAPPCLRLHPVPRHGQRAAVGHGGFVLLT